MLTPIVINAILRRKRRIFSKEDGGASELEARFAVSTLTALRLLATLGE